MGKVVNMGGKIKGDPKATLLAALDEADTFRDVAVIVQRKDDRSRVWATTEFPWFLYAAGQILTQLANSIALRDEET